MIRIDDNYCIKVDEFNYTLCKVKTNLSGKNKGQEYYESVGYYRDIIQALEAYGKQIVHQALLNGNMTLSEALAGIRDSWEQVAKTIHEACPDYHVIKSDEFQ